MAETGEGSPDTTDSGADGGPTSDPASTARLITVWERWRGGGSVPFHDYCDLFLTRHSSEGPPPSRPWLFYLTGWARLALRFTPFFILVATSLIALGSVFGNGTDTFGGYLQGSEVQVLLLVAMVGIVWLVGILSLLNRVDLLMGSAFFRAIVVYGVLLALLGDMAFRFYRVTVAIQSGTLGETTTAVFPSGFLLLLFIGGHLVYDGMLRTENMFSRLHEKEPPIIGPTDPIAPGSGSATTQAFKRAQNDYVWHFLLEFKRSLEDRIGTGDFRWPATERQVTLPTAWAFSILFVVPFFLTGLAINSASGPLLSTGNLGPLIGTTVLSVLALFEVIVFFQFMVLIKFFYRLLTAHSPYNDDDTGGFTLQYQPDHPDGYAGFRDLGQFATRVNTLLLIGGLYTAYRIYVAGLATLPSIGGIGLSEELLFWSFNFLGPLFVYLLTVIVWIYFSFWQIHKAMRRGRERRIDMLLGDRHDGELPDSKRDLKQAPIWPLNERKFISMVVGDLLPLLSLLPLLRP